MKITKDALLLASAMGAGGGGGGKGRSWPFVVPYDYFLSTTGGVLDTHDDVTGGLTPVVERPSSTFNRSELTSAGWVSKTYSNAEAGRLNFGYRIDFTNISKLCLTMSDGGTFSLQHREDPTGAWTTVTGVVNGSTYVFDTSGITGWKYIRLNNAGVQETKVHIVTGIYAISGPHLYRYGNEVASLTGGWFRPPTIVLPSECEVTKETDHISLVTTDTLRTHATAFVTQELIDLSNVAAIHFVVTNTNLGMAPTYTLYDENYAFVMRFSVSSSQMAEYKAVTDVRRELTEEYRGRYHLGIGRYSYGMALTGNALNFYDVYLEHLT